MVTPPKGEYRRIPASPAALPLINAWDPAADEKAGNQCKSYGAGGIMNVPGRLRISWQDANTLRIDTDAGTQTRRCVSHTRRPSPSRRAGRASRPHLGARGSGGGSLRVVTSNLRAGYLRKNGVPYSEQATVTEHFDVAPLPGRRPAAPRQHRRRGSGVSHRPYVTSPHFKKEPDGSKWDPTPCSSTW
jgi:hypothetical protein